ncbi:MAG: polysaccharide deacetylase family protein [Acidimicrobiales bacterium]
MLRPIPVLCYHRVGPGPGPFSTTPEVFAAHLAWLSGQGYTTLTASEVGAVAAGRAAAPVGPAVALTFDDGYADLDTAVAPALRHHGFRATSFLITDRCPADPSPGDEHLSWSAARRLADEGVLEFRSHTHSHERWELAPGLADEVADDIATSVKALAEGLGRPPDVMAELAWPWGRTCDAWDEAARRLGVGTQFVVQRGAVTRPGVTTRLPRMLVDGMSPAAFARWLRVLSTRPGALAANRVFGSIRQRRQGAGYR